MNDDSGKISGEICRQMGTCVFPLYHSVMAPPRGRVVLVAVGEGGALPNGVLCALPRTGFRHRIASIKFVTRLPVLCCAARRLAGQTL
jgi:hypothetical protein